MNRGSNRQRGSRGNFNNRRGPKERGGVSVMRRLDTRHQDASMGEGGSPSGSGCFGGLRKGFLVRGGRGLGARIGLPIGGRRKDDRGGWKKLTVLRGRQYGREWLLREIEEQIDEPIFPVHFKYDAGNVTFLLDDQDKVEAIRAVSRRFTHPGTGNKVVINVDRCEPPYIEIPPHEKQKIKEVLGRRYNSDMAHLDLTAMADDADLRFEEINCSLMRNNYMMTVAKLIGENCPLVKSINASGNRLRFLDCFSTLVYRARQVAVLNLSGNQVERPAELEKLRGWRLVDVELDGNPMCDGFHDVASYTNAVHAIFPNVTRLDGAEVAPPKGFGLDDVPLMGKAPESKRLPPILPGFTVNAELKAQLETFVLEFLGIYDDPNPSVGRQKLQPAYDEAATFTMVMEPLVPGAPRFLDDRLFQEYRHNSHNVVNKERWENHRSKLVAQGNLMVVAKLCSLPRSKHVAESLVLDVSLMLPTLVCFTLQGLFWDGPEAARAADGAAPADPDELRFFSRSFIATPRNGGISILNDMLLVGAFGVAAKARYGDALAAALHNAATAAAGPSVVPAVAAVVAAPAAESRESKIARFMVASSMKRNWAEKCLTDNDWDFDKAGAMFTEYKDKIPRDAFQ